MRVGVFMTDLGEFERMDRVYASFLPAGHAPARTTVGVAQILFGCRIEIDCVARLADAGLSATGPYARCGGARYAPSAAVSGGMRGMGCEGPSDPQLEEEILKSKRAIVTLLALVVATVARRVRRLG